VLDRDNNVRSEGAPLEVTTSHPFRREPLQHQLDCFHRFGSEEYAGLLAEMGCGKSKMLVDQIAALYLAGKINGALIFAPKGIYDDWVSQHLPADMPSNIKLRVVRWEASPNKKEMEALREICKPIPGTLDILVMNTEAVVGALPVKIATFFTKVHKALVAVDESTTIGNEKARRTNEILRIGKLAEYRRILTGDAAPNSPLTIYSQCEFLSPGVLGHASFYAFKARYCTTVAIEVERTVEGGSKKKFKVSKITGYRDLEKLREKMSKFCFVVRKEDCLDLPAKLPSVARRFSMSEQQQKIYNEMRDQSFIEIQQHIQSRHNIQQIKEDAQELQPHQEASADIKLVQLLKLHQIASGYLVSDSGEEIDIPGPNRRLELLMESLEETSGKVLIWTCYRRNIFQIEDAIRSKYGAASVETFFGDTTTEKRAEHKSRFQKDKDFRFLILNQTGCRGITLTAANSAIYYNQNHDREIRAQSEDRIHRIGQKFPCSYVDIVANKSVDETILLGHKTKKSISELLGQSNWKQLL
jgi:SNF2 family DNA or RNA helicase